jgi:hypothetical protein
MSNEEQLQQLLEQFEQGMITLTEFVFAMQALGYVISSIERVNERVAFKCYDANDKPVRMQTSYRI